MDYADTRAAIFDELCAVIPAVSNRVHWAWTAPADEVKPFIEFSFLGEIASPNKCGLHMQMEILVIGEPSNILDLDPIADLVVTALDHHPITTPDGRIIRCAYMRDSRVDMWYERLNANCIRLKFWIPSHYY
jgi:hypothetical protein